MIKLQANCRKGWCFRSLSYASCSKLLRASRLRAHLATSCCWQRLRGQECNDEWGSQAGATTCIKNTCSEQSRTWVWWVGGPTAGGSLVGAYGMAEGMDLHFSGVSEIFPKLLGLLEGGSNGGGGGGFPVWRCPSRFVICCPFWESPDLSFPLSWPLKEPTRNLPQKVRDIIRKSATGKPPGLKASPIYLLKIRSLKFGEDRSESAEIQAFSCKCEFWTLQDGHSIRQQPHTPTTVVAETITELIRFEATICICNGNSWESKENLYLYWEILCQNFTDLSL